MMLWNLLCLVLGVCLGVSLTAILVGGRDDG